MAYRGFLAPGRRWELAPLLLGVSDWKASKALSLAIGGSGVSPSRQRFWEHCGVNGTHFWIALTRYDFQPGVSDWQATKTLSFAIGGPGRSFWEHLGVNGIHFKTALTPFSTRCIRLASTESAPPRYWGSGAEPQPPKLLGAFGCEWNPFLNSVNTIFNPACQTGKRRRRSSPSLFGGSGTEPQPLKLLGAFECKWNPFLNSVNTIFNSFGAHCSPVVIVPFGNSRRGAAAYDTGACRLTHRGHRACAPKC